MRVTVWERQGSDWARQDYSASTDAIPVLGRRVTLAEIYASTLT